MRMQSQSNEQSNVITAVVTKQDGQLRSGISCLPIPTRVGRAYLCGWSPGAALEGELEEYGRFGLHDVATSRAESGGLQGGVPARSNRSQGHEAAGPVPAAGSCRLQRPSALWRSLRVALQREDGVGGDQTLTDGPPPRHAFAPNLLRSSKVIATRSTRRPLTDHPNEPLTPVEY